MVQSEFGKDWTLKWTKGIIIGFIRGKLELNRAKGMLQKSMDMGITKDQLKDIINSVVVSPVDLPSIPKSQKLSIVKKLEDAIFS